MQNRLKPPKHSDVTQLPVGGEFKVGRFWMGCKSDKRCSGPPYARLLDNAVLEADYRAPQRSAAHQERHTDAAQ